MKNKIIEEEVSLLTELEETVLRLHTFLRDHENNHDGYKALITKLQKKGPSILTAKDKLEWEQYDTFRYYRGKFYGYLYVLGRIAKPKMETVTNMIERLRGMEWADDEQRAIKETKQFRWGYHPKDE